MEKAFNIVNQVNEMLRFTFFQTFQMMLSHLVLFYVQNKKYITSLALKQSYIYQQQEQVMSSDSIFLQIFNNIIDKCFLLKLEYGGHNEKKNLLNTLKNEKIGQNL